MGYKSMKYIIITITCLFVFNNTVTANERVYSPTVPFYSQGYEIEIDVNTSIDSINNYFKENEISYATLIFKRLNEIQIDNLLMKFRNYSKVTRIYLDTCSINKLPVSFRYFFYLRELSFFKCDSIKSLSGFQSIQLSFSFRFYNCDFTELPEGIEDFRSMLSLMIVLNKENDKFDLDKSLNKFALRNNIKALFVYYYNLKEIPESLFKLTSLRYLDFFCNENVKLHKTSNLINLIDLYSNLSTESILDQSIVNNLIYRRGSADLPISDEEILEMYLDINGRTTQYVYPRMLFKDDIVLLVQPNDNIEPEPHPSIIKDYINKKAVNIDNYEFKFQKKYFEKLFKFICTNLMETDNANVKIINCYSDEELLSIDIKKGEEYLIDLEKYPDFYFYMKLTVNGKSYVRKLIME